jgi:hypothetical protein
VPFTRLPGSISRANVEEKACATNIATIGPMITHRTPLKLKTRPAVVHDQDTHNRDRAVHDPIDDASLKNLTGGRADKRYCIRAAQLLNELRGRLQLLDAGSVMVGAGAILIPLPSC